MNVDLTICEKWNCEPAKNGINFESMIKFVKTFNETHVGLTKPMKLSVTVKMLKFKLLRDAMKI